MAKNKDEGVDMNFFFLIFYIMLFIVGLIMQWNDNLQGVGGILIGLFLYRIFEGGKYE